MPLFISRSGFECCAYDKMSVSEQEQAKLVQCKRRMTIRSYAHDKKILPVFRVTTLFDVYTSSNLSVYLEHQVIIYQKLSINYPLQMLSYLILL